MAIVDSPWIAFGGERDKRNRELREQGIQMISPHRKGRTAKRTQDGRRLRRHQWRWLVERFFAWLQWKRRILCREYYTENFLGFVQMACINMLLNEFEIGSSLMRTALSTPPHHPATLCICESAFPTLAQHSAALARAVSSPDVASVLMTSMCVGLLA